MKPRLNLLILITLLTKALMIFCVNHSLTMNPDEEQNYRLALHHQQGQGYTYYNDIRHKTELSAFHGSFPVFTYEFLIMAGITKQAWVVFIYALSLLLFGVSISYFYRLSHFFLKNEPFAFWATATYCFYPATLYYIGSLFNYENIALPILVIVICQLVESVNKGSFSLRDYITIPLLITISILYRAQTLLIYAIILSVFSFIILSLRHFNLLGMVVLTTLLIMVSNVPGLVKNERMFGTYTLSTQSGFELLQGHNPTARGSWQGDWTKPGSVMYRYVHTNIPHDDSLNELQDGQARGKLATQWIKHHPIQELKLDMRKIAIFFLPMNYEVLYTSSWPDPINLLVYIFFICMLLLEVYRGISAGEWLLLAPIAGSLALTVIFFTGYRWRYYAEPFMIIFAWMFIYRIYIYYRAKQAIL